MSAEVAARRIVLVFAGTLVAGWVITLAQGISHPWWALVGLGIQSVVVGGLWMLWRPMWIFVLAITVFGEVKGAIHPSKNISLLVIGGIQLVLLLHPSLRCGLSARRERLRAARRLS